MFIKISCFGKYRQYYKFQFLQLLVTSTLKLLTKYLRPTLTVQKEQTVVHKVLVVFPIDHSFS